MSSVTPATARAHGLFEQLATVSRAAAENHVAIVDGAARVAYADLLRAACDFCDSLEAAHVLPGDRVAVILGNQREFLVAAFGVWKRGAILMPLNPQFREAEIAGCLLDTSARVLVTGVHNERMLRALRGSGIPIDHAWLWSPEPQRWLYDGTSQSRSIGRSDEYGATSASSRPALTQYSTGSTGRPKRITRNHDQLLGEVRSIAEVLRVTPAERILGAAPYFHSYGLMVSALLALLSGATLYTLDTFLPSNVGRLIERERLSGLPLVPLMFQLLAECKPAHDLSSVRYCLSAGAPLARVTADNFSARYGKRIGRLYGSTETGVIAISGHGPGDDEVSSVGPPIPGVSINVVDDKEHALPAGHEGLVRIRSPFSAVRYDGDAVSGDSYFTGQGFIPGDTGRIGADGALTLGGRRRSFINTHGYKVDPAEIERILLELPGVTDAVVLGVGDGAADERIKAVLIAPSGGSQQAVREHCLRRLAPFKCPQIIEFRSELPRNLLGKVLRKYLLDESPSAPPP